MSNASVILAKEFNPAKISYGPIKAGEAGTRSAFIAYDGAPLILQLPLLTVPYAINETGFNGAALTKYELPVSFRNYETDPIVKQVYDKFNQLEDKLVQDGVANSLSWLKKKTVSEDGVRELLTPIVKHDKDKETGEIADKYPPTFRVKLPYDFKTRTWLFQAYDMNNNEIDFGTIKPNIKAGARVRLLIKLTGLWFSAKGFGVTWKVHQGKFEPVTAAPAGPIFRLDDDETTPVVNNLKELEDEAANDAEVAEVQSDSGTTDAQATTTSVPVVAEEEEEEEEDDDDEAAAAALAAAAAAKAASEKKKRGTTKKT